MKSKRLSLVIVALLAAGGGLWLARSTWRTHLSNQSNVGIALETPQNHPTPGQIVHSPARLAPPDPMRRFRDFTPEQRVDFARKGHGPGG